MCKKSLLMMLLLALLVPWAANAQKALPYSYGFENNDLDAEGWTVQRTSTSTGISTSAKHEGSYGFQFVYSERNAYLVSPELSGTGNGVALSFYYKEYSSSYGDEQFYVGYTTDETVTDPSAFTYGDITTASLAWQLYETMLPAGTKKVAIKYVYNDAFYLYLDDFTFEAPSACPKPTDLNFALTQGDGTVATLSWTSDADAWQICLNGDETNLIPATTKPYTLTGLTPETTYTAKVRANCGSEQSGWSNEVTFTPTDAYQITVNDGTSTNSYVPYYAYYHDSQQRSEFIIPASSLSDLAWGTITSMKFYPNYTYTTSASIKVYLMEVEEETFSDVTFYGETDATVVYDGTLSISPNGMTIAFAGNGFRYSGGNLLVGFYQSAGGSGYYSSSSCPFYGVSATGASISQYSSYSGLRNFLPKTTFDYIPGEQPSCMWPTNLAAGTPGARSVELSWTENGEATTWNIGYQIVGEEEQYVEVTENPYTLTGLRPETDYQVRVQSKCSDTEYSVFTSFVDFTTDVACHAPTNVAVSDVEPFAATVSWNGTAENYNIRYRAARGFNYGFETAEAFVVDEFPPCTTYDGDGLTTYGISGYTMPNNTANYVGSVVSFNEYWDAHSGNTLGVFMDAIPDTEAGITANDDYFITPALTIAAGDHFQFWARSVTNSYGLERMKVGIYGGEGTISTYFAGSADEYVEVPVAWTKYDYDLTAYVGQTIQLAINCVSADAFALLFDDLFVGDPTDDTWDVTLTDVTSPCTLTGLNDETLYEVQVQAACGGIDGVSAWVGTNFTTPSNCAAPTNVAANNITYNAATLSWEGFHNTYNVQYRTAESRETYYFTNFNTDADREGWTWTGYAIYGISDPIYGFSSDDNYFLQMGWGTTDEAYIISPELPAYESGAIVEFYYFAYQQANTFQIGYSTTTNDADAFTWSDPIDAPTTRYNLYQEVLAAGVKYIAWKATASAQEACVFIDNFGIFGETIPAGAWQTLNAVTSPQNLTGLADETKYEWQVQGINPGCEGGATEWSHMATFTTLDACMTPVIDSVVNIEATTATVYWTGAQDSYNVRYGAFVPAAVINFDDQVIPADWTNDETYPWALTDTLTDAGYCLRSTNQGVASSSASISFTATYEAAGVISFDAMFMGEGTSTIYDKCIFSIDGNQQFAYGAIGQAWYNMAYYFAAGTHTFTWTYSKDGSVDPTGDFFAIDNIKIQLHNDTWTTVENVTGNSYNMTGLTPESVIAVQVQGNNTVCNDGVTEWSSEYLFITPVQTNLTQTVALTTGNNWFSTYVDITLEDLQNALDAVNTNNKAITIKSQTANSIYVPRTHRWNNGDLTWDVANMYQIILTEDCEITLEGAPINPADHPITIAGGGVSTWIGFPFSESMTLTEAFAALPPTNGDNVKYQNANAIFSRNNWTNGITQLEPGKGYIYKSASNAADRTLVFPTNAKKAAKAGVKGTVNDSFTKIIKSNRKINKVINYNTKAL